MKRYSTNTPNAQSHPDIHHSLGPLGLTLFAESDQQEDQGVSRALQQLFRSSTEQRLNLSKPITQIGDDQSELPKGKL